VIQFNLFRYESIAYSLAHDVYVLFTVNQLEESQEILFQSSQKISSKISEDLKEILLIHSLFNFRSISLDISVESS
jgi:hypothetical protein